MDRVLKNDRYHLYDVLNPTMGTGIIMGVEVAYGETVALLSHYNPPTSQMNVVPESIRLRVADAGVATASLQAALVLDKIDRHSAGGSALAAVDRKISAPRASVAEIHFGALTMVAADAAAKRVAQRILKASALAVADEFLLDFETPRTEVGIDLGRVVVRPGDNLVLHVWAPAQTTPPEFEVAYRWREVQVR